MPRGILKLGMVLVPVTRKQRQGGQDFKVILNYTTSMRPVSATWDKILGIKIRVNPEKRNLT